jgi:hypothetical protein
MSDDSYYVEQRQPQYRKPFRGQRFDPSRRTRPVWTTRQELFEVLAKYRKWYEQGLSDRQISYAISKLP